MRYPRGCPLVNSVAELSTHDDVLGLGKRAREHVEAFFAGCLKEARTRGEIGAVQDLRALARFLTNSLFGLRVIAKMEPNRKLVDDIVATTPMTLSKIRIIRLRHASAYLERAFQNAGEDGIDYGRHHGYWTGNH